MNNLFLTGPIQVGKSTLIRKGLAPWLEMDPTPVGGFSCQRILLDESDKTIAFRMGSATEPIEVAGTYRDVLLASNVFKAFRKDGRVYVDNSVFNTMGVLYMLDAASGWLRYSGDPKNGTGARQLDQTASKFKIMLLDEIGGHDLICERFFDVLMQLLTSDVPCIGVLKSQASVARMTKNMAQKSHAKAMEAKLILERNKMLHDLIGGKSLADDGQETSLGQEGNQKIAGNSGDSLIWVEGNDESRNQAFEQIQTFLQRYL